MGYNTYCAEYKYIVLKCKWLSPKVAAFIATYIQSHEATSQAGHRGRDVNDRKDWPPHPHYIELL